SEIVRFMEKVEVSEPQTEDVIRLVAEHLLTYGISFEEKVAAEVVRLTNRLIHHLPQPEKSLDVIEEIAASGRKNITIKDVQDFISVKTGVPVSGVSEQERNMLLNMEPLLTQRIIGQDKAVAAISEALRRARSGLNTDNRP